MSGINLTDLLVTVVKPSLSAIGLYSPAAGVLLVGTYLVEGYAGGEARLRQVKGPAVGLWQMEEPTYNDCFTNFLNARSALRDKINALALAGKPDFHQMAGNLYFACALARIKYLRAPAELPPLEAHAMADFHKKWYNSNLGAANPDVNSSMFSCALTQLSDKL